MRLDLHRRHLKKCRGGHKQFSRSYESQERKKGWKGCGCTIYAAGTIAGKFERRSTELTVWEDARKLADQWQKAGTWDSLATPDLHRGVPPPGQTLTIAGHGQGEITIQFAADAYLANRAGRHIADSTMSKYRTLTKKLREFAGVKGYVMIDQFRLTDMDEFYSGWKDGIRAKGKKRERLVGFFNFCVKRKWIKENPAADLEAPVGAGSAANRIPFTDAELAKIYQACDRLPEIKWKNHLGIGSWDGEDVKTMIMLLCWTGLRISDGATFDMSRVTPHPEGGANVFLRMHKTKGPLFTWIDTWLYERLLARERKCGHRIFRCGNSEKLATVTENWRRKINRAFDVSAPFDCGTPTPHVFRHTFVRLLLQRGVSPRDVADLIGDTEEVVVKHYARWVPERQERLTNILREKLADAPKPKLVAIAGNRK